MGYITSLTSHGSKPGRWSISISPADEVLESLRGKVLDTAVVGGGPAGLAAAMYAPRFGLTTLIITQEV
ncbi:FAD-binding protein [Thermoproteus tenax]|uniref:FAD-binding protein n=1 Tax=Thermoproteus tenax TaxID=2271 RepID=UPI0030B83642